jgi:hypothetical protein
VEPFALAAVTVVKWVRVAPCSLAVAKWRPVRVGRLRLSLAWQKKAALAKSGLLLVNLTLTKGPIFQSKAGVLRGNKQAVL